MKRLGGLNIGVLVISSFLSCTAIFHPGTYDKEEFLLYQNFLSKNCSSLEICFTDHEKELWNNDSLGLSGDRRRILIENFERFSKGELNGISYDCMIELLGKPTESSPEPVTDSAFSYVVSQNHDSLITMSFWYNQYFNKVLESKINIALKKLPKDIKKRKCSETFRTRIDSILSSDIYKDGETIIVLAQNHDEISRLCYLDFRGTNVLLEFVDNPIGCLLCYFGEPSVYNVLFSCGAWTNYSKATFATFRNLGYSYDYRVFISNQTGQILKISRLDRPMY